MPAPGGWAVALCGRHSGCSRPRVGGDQAGTGAFVAENPAERDIGAIDWLVENERELRDSIEIRTALEPMAARRMAERCNTEDIRRLENIHRSFLSAIQEGGRGYDRPPGRAVPQRHRGEQRNALMIEINSHVCQGMQTFRSKTFQVEQNVKNAVMPHSNIMNAILAPGCRPGGAGDAGPSGQGPGGSDPEHPCPGTRDKIIGTAQPGSLRPPSRTGAAGGFLLCPGREEDTVRLRQRCFDVPGRRAGSRGKPALYNMLRNLRKERAERKLAQKMREEFCRLFPLTS